MLSVVKRLISSRRRRINLGDLHRTDPVSRLFGFDRGTPVDRLYIEHFLGANAAKIQGNTLEIADSSYTKRFGGNRVSRADVLSVQEGGEPATFVADLQNAPELPSDRFDCAILTQTLQFTKSPKAALETVHRILKPGGYALVTVPGISQISRFDADRWGDYWRFTSQSMRLLFDETFGANNVEVRSYGNVLAAIAFLHGLAVHELTESDLMKNDPDYEVLIGVVARRETLARR